MNINQRVKAILSATADEPAVKKPRKQKQLTKAKAITDTKSAPSRKAEATHRAGMGSAATEPLPPKPLADGKPSP